MHTCGAVIIHTLSIVTNNNDNNNDNDNDNDNNSNNNSVAILAQVATFVRIPSYSSETVGGKGRGGLGTMVCTSFALRDDTNTGPAGHVGLESVMEGELPGVDCCVGREIDLLAATPFVLVPAFFAAYVGWPSFLAVDSPVAAPLLAATVVYAALSGFFVGLPRRWFMLRFQMAMVEMLAATGTLWSL